MKKGIILTLSLLLAGVLLTAGLFGCGNNSPAETKPSAVTPPAAPAPVATPPEVNVSLNTQTKGIWVSGSGKVAVTPDIALLRLGIEAQEVSVVEAQASAKEAMAKVMAALAESGVAEKDIQTQNFRIRQRTRWDDEKQQEVVTGYTVTNDVIAKIREMDKTGEIIDAVVTAGGDYTRIDDLNFSVEDPAAYYDEARENAITDAKDKAEKIAALSGVRMGDPTYITESSSSSFYNYMSMGMAMPTAIPAPVIITEAASISPGEVEITVNMQVAYEIEDITSSVVIPPNFHSEIVPPASEGKVYIEGDNKSE